MGYDEYGRIRSKQAQGQDVFSDAIYDDWKKPHAIREATVETNPFDGRSQVIQYTMFDKVASIRVQDGQTLSYHYGYDHQRIKLTEIDREGPTLTCEKTYVGNCEFWNTCLYGAKSLTYLSGPMGVYGVVEKNAGGESLHYIYKDHLGSWTTITDEDGEIYVEQSFDAWGKMRDPYTWREFPSGGTRPQGPMFDRGFTGHEHLFEFGLINMNGRMYDPVMSTFLSVDNYVQAPDYSQAFNRYAYCFNNPLKYTDPSGEIAVVDDIIIAALIGGTINAIIQGCTGNINSAGDFALAFGVGALSGAVGAWAGGAAFSAAAVGGFQGGFAAGLAGGAAGGFVGGAGNAWCNGASFGSGLLAGWNGAITGALIGGVTGGLSRGIRDYRKGYSFLDGKRTIDFSAPEIVTMDKAYPNLRNFSNYEEIEAMETAALQRRTAWNYSIGEGDMRLCSLTTEAPEGYSVNSNTGLFINDEGRQILGRTIECSTGYIEVHVSPYASTHASESIFRATVGHEFTHAFHFYSGLSVQQNGASERAALDYSYMEYYRAGYADLMNTIPTHGGYNQKYYVPQQYKFSTIDFYKSFFNIH